MTLQAKGTDAAGTKARQQQRFGSLRRPWGGIHSGKMLEEGRWLKLAGGTVALTDTNGTTKTLTSATAGGYFLETPAGNALVKITKPGYTTVERLVPVIPEKNITVLDARLTHGLYSATNGSFWRHPPFQGTIVFRLRLYRLFFP